MINIFIIGISMILLACGAIWIFFLHGRISGLLRVNQELRGMLDRIGWREK